MLTKVYTASIQGIDAFPVTIETDGAPAQCSALSASPTLP